MKIVGVGKYLPERTAPTSEVEKYYNLPAGWCEKKMGIVERRFADLQNETVTSLGAEAAKEAVADAELSLSDIDLIISASGHTYEKLLPHQGALLQEELGLVETGVACISIDIGCLSFMLALNISGNLLVTGQYRNILIISSTITSIICPSGDPVADAMAGDGAGAVVVSASVENELSCLNAVYMNTYSQEEIKMKGDITGKVYSIDDQEVKISIDHKSVQTSTAKYNQNFLKGIRNDYFDSLKLVIPNQNNKLQNTMMKFWFPAEKVKGIFERIGNLGAVGYPIALYEAVKEEQIQRGDIIGLIGSGWGLTLCGAVLTY